MDDDRWIDAKQRQPTKEDCDVFNCVLAYHIYNGSMVIGWHQVTPESMFTHWMPLPLPPECHRSRHGRTVKK